MMLCFLILAFKHAKRKAAELEDFAAQDSMETCDDESSAHTEKRRRQQEVIQEFKSQIPQNIGTESPEKIFKTLQDIRVVMEC